MTLSSFLGFTTALKHEILYMQYLSAQLQFEAFTGIVRMPKLALGNFHSIFQKAIQA